MSSIKGTALDATLRTPVIQVMLEVFDWEKGQVLEELDLTNNVTSYQFQKTIKTPMSGAVLQCIPEWTSKDALQTVNHLMDVIQPMDVIKIYEFGTLKFQGFVRRVSVSAQMTNDGKPLRTFSITVSGFGALFVEGKLSLGLIAARLNEDKDAFKSAGGGYARMIKKIVDALSEGVAYRVIAVLLIDEWITLLESMGAESYLQYIQRYIDYETALFAHTYDDVPVWPKNANFFYPQGADELSIWTELQKLVEAPFNEFFFDEGPRRVTIKDKQVELPEGTHLIGRPTPINGTVRDGVTTNYFDKLDLYGIPLTHLIRYDLNKTMEESTSVYLPTPAHLNLNIWTLRAMGAYVIDEDRFKKYLYRPMNVELFYSTGINIDGKKKHEKDTKMQKACIEIGNTLKAWYESNDEFLSGALTFMVPSDPNSDPRIGEQTAIENLEGFFYIEGISHEWTYGGPIRGTATVTRGYGADQAIELSNHGLFGGKHYE